MALTFDDGPHPEFTPRLLALLSKLDIKATFFVIGQQAKRYPDVLKAIASEGHEIGNHSWSHGLGLLQTKARLVYEIEKTQNIIHDLTGDLPTWYRPPYGVFGFGMKKVLDELGLSSMLWSQSLWDYKYQSQQKLAFYFNRGLQKSPTIFLMHDGNFNASNKNRQPTLQLLEAILPTLLTSGYECLTLSKLFSKA